MRRDPDTGRILPSTPAELSAAKARRKANNHKYNKTHYAKHKQRVIANVQDYKSRFYTRVREAQRNSCRRARYQMIVEYGGKCACCGENRPQFLTLDHVNGNGAEHRREITGKRSGGGYTIALWLRAHGWPKDGYQLLCWNCNCARGFSGYCHPQLVLSELA